MKKRIFAMILCSAMIISAIGVSAASRSKNFGSGGSYANAYLNTYSYYGTAKTEPTTSYYSADARIRFYGIAEVWPWAYGSWELEDGKCVAVQYTADLDGVYMAESFHQINSVSTYLTAEYY